jgi:two-component system phosphate regulon sensor histidine kinase PhoR
MKDYARQRNIAISSSPDIGSEAYIYGSYTFLLRAFNNILMNAIKYNRENGTIAVTCLENTDKNTLVINFNDSGIGIPPEDLKRVFKIFGRGKQARRNPDGSLGLGMALVKQIVRYHLGEIVVTSAVDIGTTVIVTLPLFKPIKKQEGTDES